MVTSRSTSSGCCPSQQREAVEVGSPTIGESEKTTGTHLIEALPMNGDAVEEGRLRPVHEHRAIYHRAVYLGWARIPGSLSAR
eukprot:scaffold99138_cov30-Tisochrysis_lutea.AAC.4